MKSFRTRLTATTVALVGVTAIALALGSWLVTARSLRADLAGRAVSQVEFNVGVLAVAPGRLPDEPTISELEQSPLIPEFRLRGTDGVYVELSDGTYLSGFAFNRPPSPELRSAVAAGNLATEWIDLAGNPYLMVGARRPPSGPGFFFFFDARILDDTLRRLAWVLGAGASGLILVAVAIGRAVARRVLLPVRQAASAAASIAAGDLATRLAVEGEDEFARWAATFNQMAAALEEHVKSLEEAQAAQRRFVSDVSHELRTPLTALVNEAMVLSDHLDRLPPGVARMAELLVDDVARLRKLTEDLLETSRLDAGITLESRPTNLAPFLEALVGRRANSDRIQVRAAGTATVDRQALERVVGNLVDNALVHAPDSTVVLEGTTDGGALTIRVIDHGPGVSPEDYQRIFERFWKGDPARSGGGSGLGLAIARDYARRMGGDLSAHPTPGGGLTVELAVTGLLPGGDVVVTPVSDSVEVRKDTL